MLNNDHLVLQVIVIVNTSIVSFIIEVALSGEAML
jgi:hypothetical protein